MDVAENLEDAGTDLLDYCVRWELLLFIYLVTVFHRCITHLIYPIDEEAKEFVPADKEDKLTRQELLEQLKEMKEVLGLRCISILRYNWLMLMHSGTVFIGT